MPCCSGDVCNIDVQPDGGTVQTCPASVTTAQPATTCAKGGSSCDDKTCCPFESGTNTCVKEPWGSFCTQKICAKPGGTCDSEMPCCSGDVCNIDVQPDGGTVQTCPASVTTAQPATTCAKGGSSCDDKTCCPFESGTNTCV